MATINFMPSSVWILIEGGSCLRADTNYIASLWENAHAIATHVHMYVCINTYVTPLLHSL